MTFIKYDPDDDYEYGSDLTDLVEYLQRVAIDAYVVSKYGDGANRVSMTDQSYLIAFSTDTGQGGRLLQIKRPYMSGDGGGEILSDSAPPPLGEDDCSAEFEKVRKRLRGILKPWLKLPSPARIEKEIDKWLDASREISSPTRTINAKLYGGASVDASIRQIGTWIGTMNGEVVGKVASFTSKLQGVIDSLCGEFLLWGGTLNSEKTMFEETRRVVVKAITEGIKMFDTVSSQRLARMNVPLKVVSTAIDGLMLFVSPEYGATKKVLEGAGITVKGIDSLIDEKIQPKTTSTYDSAVKEFEAAFKRIDRSTEKSEKGVERVLYDNLGTMVKNRSAYDIQMDPMDSTNVDVDRGRPRELNVNNVTAENIARAMHAVCGNLRNTVKKIPAVSMYSCVGRDEKVGIGDVGPSRAFDQFQFRLSELIKNLADDLENEAKNFQLAIAAITEQDAQARAQLEQTVEDIKRNPGDPWVVRGSDKRHQPVKGNQIV